MAKTGAPGEAGFGKALAGGDGAGFGTGLLHRLVGHMLDGHDVVVRDPTGGGPILDLLAIALRARNCRVLRVKGGSTGRLSDLLAQVTGQPCDGAPDETMLERSFDLLCTPDDQDGRIVILIADADRLGHKEFRYLHLAAKSGPLQFVLAAAEDPLPILDGDLALLHNRLAAFQPLVIEPGTPLAVLIPPTPRTDHYQVFRPALQIAPAPSPRRQNAVKGVAAAMLLAAVAITGGLVAHLLGAPPISAAATAAEHTTANAAPVPAGTLPAVVAVAAAGVARPGGTAAVPPAQAAGRAAPASVHRIGRQPIRARPPQLAVE